MFVKEARAADSQDWWHYFPQAHSVLFLESFLADECANLIYKEQDVLSKAIPRGCAKLLERTSMHTHKNLFCSTMQLWCAKKQMQICKHPLDSNPILWCNLFSHRCLRVHQSLSNVAIFHSGAWHICLLSHISTDQGCSPRLLVIVSDISTVLKKEINKTITTVGFETHLRNEVLKLSHTPLRLS